MNTPLPPIPVKRYFTIGEVAELCDVKPHVLRYWEQEFTQLRPMKRRGNRRYYQHHEVLMIRRIRELLYEQGFTISGARSRLQNWSPSKPPAAEAALAAEPAAAVHEPAMDTAMAPQQQGPGQAQASLFTAPAAHPGMAGPVASASTNASAGGLSWDEVREELSKIRAILSN
ncbi:MerR family transcriptional regulator [Vandammella animalimorsus]|uniref:MerR family transcriptional regulator n=1 Tax=Vandammella animalimorsus TaxID=2029117 RepID=A0A2A2AIT9_9BURK|nr:MerR family transcriptional regulator [Vandammella animalimorsus]PAT37519.1 MerR family transcriptional regulator [Vandammella animalimorsus]